MIIILFLNNSINQSQRSKIIINFLNIMKKYFIFCFLIFAILSVDTLVSIDFPKNFIENGNFSKNRCLQQYCIYDSVQSIEVESWYPDVELQIGVGMIYSDFMGNQLVLQLAPNKNTCVKQTIPMLKPGKYELSIAYAARKDRTFDDCMFYVELEGQKTEIKPTDYSVKVEKISLKIEKLMDNATIRFCSFGGEDNSYGAILKDVKLFQVGQLDKETAPNQSLAQHYLQVFSSFFNKVYLYVRSFFISEIKIEQYKKNQELPIKLEEKIQIIDIQEQNLKKQEQKPKIQPNTPQIVVYQSFGKKTQKSKQNLIINGGFDRYICGRQWCSWHKNAYNTTFVPGWLPFPEIQIGLGTIYNSFMTSSYVSQLDANQNTCIKQSLPNLFSGKYMVKFSWAARQNVSFDSCMFMMSLGTQINQHYIPTDYQLYKVSIQFSVEKESQREIMFCGFGQVDGLGAVVDDVQLYYLGQ